jgi:hypothetical protein
MDLISVFSATFVEETVFSPSYVLGIFVRTQVDVCISEFSSLFHKNHMIIVIDGEKAFNEIQHPFMKKALRKLRKGMYLNIIKVIYDKPIANTKWGKSETIPLKSETSKGVHFLHSY